MESRLSLYKKKRSKKTIQLIMVLVLIVFFTTSFFINKLLPGTFAFYTAEVHSSGTIANARSSDLIEVNTGSIEYEKNCKIKSSITIKNKSMVEIPITIELVNKNGGKHSTSTILKPDSTFSTNQNDTDQLPNRCGLQEIEYHIIGFNGYIDEIYTIPVDQQKLAESKDKSNAKEETPAISGASTVEIIPQPKPSIAGQHEENVTNTNAQNTSGEVSTQSLDMSNQINP